MRSYVALVVACLCAGCANEPSQTIAKPPARQPSATDHPNDFLVKHDDAEVNAAMMKARETFPEFLDLLDHSIPGDRAEVKVGFPTLGGSYEYMWVYDINVDKDKFTGVLVEDAFDVPGFTAGKTVNFTPSQIGDWAYEHKGKIHGNFTVDILKRRKTQGSETNAKP